MTTHLTFTFSLWDGKKLGQLFGLVFFAQKQCVCKKSLNRDKKKRSQKSYGISYKIPAGLQTNSLSTPFMGGKLCVKNISQCFNCIYFWSFPDLIYDRIFITTHLCIDYQKKQSILDSLYLQMNDRCKKKTICSLSTLRHSRLKHQSFIQCMHSSAISRSMFRQWSRRICTTFSN